MYFVYLIRCADNTLYCGSTNNLEERLRAHNSGKNVGAKYTRGRTPVKLVYWEELPDKSAALKREIALKRWTKKQKEALISIWNRASSPNTVSPNP